MMLTIDPAQIPVPQLHQYLVGSVAPRPIAFVSTLSKDGIPNLAPYSFFNVFSSNPPVCVFSSNRRISNNTTKDTLHNIEATGECVINVVNYGIVQQAALCSVEFAPEVSEFERSGLTPLPADLVRPFRVRESPVHFECRLRQLLPLGQGGGAGHLIICDILRLHLSPDIFDEQGRIDPHRIDLMGRMGRAFYTRASGIAIHQLFQDFGANPIGFAALPEGARHSTVLTGYELGRLARLDAAPGDAQIAEAQTHAEVVAALRQENRLTALHQLARREIAKENVAFAAAVVWLAENLNHEAH